MAYGVIIVNIFCSFTGSTFENSMKSGSLEASGQFSLVAVPLTAKTFES